MKELTLKFKVDFVHCPKCGKKPINYKTKTVEEFLHKHRRHSSETKFLKVVGYLVKPSTLKKRKITIRLLNEKEK